MWHWRSSRGFIRRKFLVVYYTFMQKKSLMGIFVRFWAWLNYADKDEELNKTVAWKYNINETVQLSSSRHIGIIYWRWVRFGQKMYEIKCGTRSYAYYERELKKTDLRLYSKVKIEEIPFKTLREGHSCQPTHRWSQTFYHHPRYSNTSARYAIKQF